MITLSFTESELNSIANSLLDLPIRHQNVITPILAMLSNKIQEAANASSANADSANAGSAETSQTDVDAETSASKEKTED